MNESGRKPWVRAAILVLLLAGVTWLGLRYAAPITRLVGNTERFSRYILSFGTWGVLVFMAMQVLQVVVAPIPGEFTQFAGGYLYGTVYGTAYSVAGILVGAAIVFAAGRLFGFPLLKAVVPAAKLRKFEFLINNPKAEILMLALFLIPGSPKDFLTYIAGVTPVRPLRFLLPSMVARLPGILLSSYIGAHVEENRLTEVIVASAIAIGLFVIGVLFQDRITRSLKRRHAEKRDEKPGRTDGL